MSSVPRNQANVEVEGGETVVGDVNNDGYLEHFTFVGNKHSQGGIPVFYQMHLYFQIQIS